MIVVYCHALLIRLKGTVLVISSGTLLMEWHDRFATVPLKALSDQKRMWYPCLFSFILSIFYCGFSSQATRAYLLKKLWRKLSELNTSRLTKRQHCGLKVSRSQVKVYENFANYFLKTKANHKCFIVLNVHVKGYRKV